MAMSDGGKIALFLGLIVVAAIILILLYITFFNKARKEGETCDTTETTGIGKYCAAGLYCGGDQICHTGTGGTGGSPCGSGNPTNISGSGACVLGYTCTNKVCTSNTNSNNNSTNSGTSSTTS